MEDKKNQEKPMKLCGGATAPYWVTISSSGCKREHSQIDLLQNAKLIKKNESSANKDG